MRIGVGACLGRLPDHRAAAASEAQLAMLKRLGPIAAKVIANGGRGRTPVERQLAPMLANGLKS
jgi:hypothetical protein